MTKELERTYDERCKHNWETRENCIKCGKTCRTYGHKGQHTCQVCVTQAQLVTNKSDIRKDLNDLPNTRRDKTDCD